MSNPFKFSSIIAFITGDIIAPTINTLTPADNATGVAIADNFVIVFSEAVNPVSGNINLYKSDDTLIEAIDVTSGQVTGGGTATITINPSASLDPLTSYYIKIDATAFDDLNGNSFAGIADTTTWNFTTIGGDSDTYMIVSALDPDELDTYVDGVLVEKKMGTQHRIKVPILFDDKLSFTQTDGNEYIDSLADGELDLGATTAINMRSDVLFIGDGIGLPYGHMYTNTAITVTVGAMSTWYEVDVNTPDFTTGEVNLVTFSDHYLAPTKAGRYLINWGASLETASANQEVAATIGINGTASETGHGHTTIVTANAGVQLAGTTILDLAANDQISLFVQNHTGVTDITITHAQVSMTMVGGT